MCIQTKELSIERHHTVHVLYLYTCQTWLARVCKIHNSHFCTFGTAKVFGRFSNDLRCERILNKINFQNHTRKSDKRTPNRHRNPAVIPWERKSKIFLWMSSCSNLEVVYCRPTYDATLQQISLSACEPSMREGHHIKPLTILDVVLVITTADHKVNGLA